MNSAISGLPSISPCYLKTIPNTSTREAHKSPFLFRHLEISLNSNRKSKSPCIITIHSNMKRLSYLEKELKARKNTTENRRQLSPQAFIKLNKRIQDAIVVSRIARTPDLVDVGLSTKSLIT